ncbi:acyl-CoA carboxylase subunit epsilon [Streptomyces sp. NBC_01591]|uniref:acyl-CoA carboxylase subunit epsilon n=1 Tax=Streptomyces sp. NBC_01591 TaxID=2975888 RepID=UPI002DD89CEA|nr:acyl-CoA carboxylase subunit epsilon [Streptomyces sp. NBC_01591]WSD70630.1 acyl-CoA carboxylase subunit epsilon [Streptomyces sp. NBC_01591]
MTNALQDPPGPASVRVVNGAPTPEELAAVTVVLTALQGGEESAPEPQPTAATWRRAGADTFPPVSWRARE